MVDKEVHPLVTLMIERMKSHPEEFSGGNEEAYVRDDPRHRWHRALTAIEEYGSEADIKALETPLREIQLEAAHKWALDELMNGEARRANIKRELEMQMKNYSATLAVQSGAMLQNTAQLQGYAQATSAQAGTSVINKLLNKFRP